MPEEFMLHEETERSDALVAELAELWERSVRATHNFLAEGGVEFYKPYVVEAIKSLPLRRRQRTKPARPPLLRKTRFPDRQPPQNRRLRQPLPDTADGAAGGKGLTTANEQPPRVKNARGLRLISSICSTLYQELEQIRFVVEVFVDDVVFLHAFDEGGVVAGALEFYAYHRGAAFARVFL